MSNANDPVLGQYLPSDIDPANVYDLEQPRTFGMPVITNHRPGYYYALHRRHSDTYDPETTGPRTSAAGMIVLMEHSGTHIDALSHQADHMTLCGGIRVEDVEHAGGFTKHGVEEIDPLVGPAVLLDVPALLGVEWLEPEFVITREHLQACCKRQSVEVNNGDILLVRTGNARLWHDEDQYLAGPGMSGDASQWAADLGVTAVGADNMAWDVVGRWDDDYGCLMPGHLILLARAGIYIIENLQLERLAADNHYRFTFVCLPLKFVGATGSPVRPIAVIQK